MAFYIDGIGDLDYAPGMIFSRKEIAKGKHDDWVEGRQEGRYTTDRTLEQFILKQETLYVSLVIQLEQDLPQTLLDILENMIGLSTKVHSVSQGDPKRSHEEYTGEMYEAVGRSKEALASYNEREVNELIDASIREDQIFQNDLPKPLLQVLQNFVNIHLGYELELSVQRGEPRCVFIGFEYKGDIEDPDRFLRIIHVWLLDCLPNNEAAGG